MSDNGNDNVTLGHDEPLKIREYDEEMAVEIIPRRGGEADGRLVIKAYNECGFRATEVDLGDVLAWAAKYQLEMVRKALHIEGYHVS